MIVKFELYHEVNAGIRSFFELWVNVTFYEIIEKLPMFLFFISPTFLSCPPICYPKIPPQWSPSKQAG